MSTDILCPARRHDREEDRVICVREPNPPAGAWCFICWRCLEAMVTGAANRQAVREEWELET